MANRSRRSQVARLVNWRIRTTYAGPRCIDLLVRSLVVALVLISISHRASAVEGERIQVPPRSESFSSPQQFSSTQQQFRREQPQVIHQAPPRAIDGRYQTSDQNASDTIWLPKNNAVQQATFVETRQSSAQEQFAPSSGPRDSIPLRPPSNSKLEASSSQSNSWTSIVSMLTSLLVVIGIFFGLAWLLRRTVPSTSSTIPKEVVEVVGRSAMASRQQLYVIRFGRKLVLVSQQPGQTEVLSEIDDRSEVDHLLGLCEQARPQSVTASFRNVLNQVATAKDSRWTAGRNRSSSHSPSRETGRSESASPRLDTLG